MERVKLGTAVNRIEAREKFMEDYTKIYDMPPVPGEIIDAVNNERFAVFTGAGISRLAGCRSWAELASELVEKCYLPIDTKVGTSKIDFRQKENLNVDTDYKKTITIIKEIYSENDSIEQFYKEVEDLLNARNEKAVCPEIYNELFGIRGLCLTTNIDTHCDKPFENRVVYIDREFDYEYPDRTKIYHIHGSIKKPEDMVLTLAKYFDRYLPNTNVHLFLDKVFKEYSILFIGYGLGEFEILDYLFTKFAERSGQQHFILLPFYTGEESRLKLEQYYYNAMHITVVAYRADSTGYARLNDVIKQWVKEIKLKSIDLTRRYKEIDAIVERLEHE